MRKRTIATLLIAALVLFACGLYRASALWGWGALSRYDNSGITEMSPIHHLAPGDTEMLHRTDGVGGAQQRANSHLKIHPTKEWYTSNRGLEEIPQVVTCSAPIPDKAIPSTDKPIITGTLKVPTGGLPYLSYGLTRSIEFYGPSQGRNIKGYITTVVGAITCGGIAGPLALLGVSLDMLKDKPDEYPVTFNDAAWNSPWSTFSAGAAVAAKNDCVMYPRAVLRWQRHYLEEDTYDKSGFVGTGLAYRDKYTGAAPAGCGIVKPGVWGVFVLRKEAR